MVAQVTPIVRHRLEVDIDVKFLDNKEWRERKAGGDQSWDEVTGWFPFPLSRSLTG